MPGADRFNKTSVLPAEADIPLHFLEEGFGLSGHRNSLVVKLSTESSLKGKYHTIGPGHA